MPEENRNTDFYVEPTKTSDENTLAFYQNIVRAYHEMGLLSDGDKNAAEEMTDLDAINKIIAKVPEMTREQRLEFCDRFVGDDLENFNGATPAILAWAYRAAFARAKYDDAQKERLKKLASHIDDLSADFANASGTIVDFKVVNPMNVADVYPGFADMLSARMGDLDKTDETKNAERRQEMDALGVGLGEAKINEINKNFEILEDVIGEYDDTWGLAQLASENAARLERRWDALTESVARAEISENTKGVASKYKFLDAEGKVIPQFKSTDRNDTTEYEDYTNGRTIIKDGRLATVVELARHDVAKKHVCKVDEEIDDDALEQELNDEIMFKLYNTSIADKFARAAADDPEVFTDPASRDEIIQTLSQNGGEISDMAYTASLNAHVNATAGWAARIKAKIGNAASKVGGFFGKIFNPIKRVDRMAGARMTAATVNKREKRIEFFKRILKGFASAFIASALITTIATAAAATAGISVAASLAMIGFITALGLGLIQVNRWRKSQRAKGLPTDIHAFLADKRLVTSLGVSAIAIVAMCFGAAGMAQAAMTLGYGALALGGGKNAVEMYRDARSANMSVVESLAWAIANAGAIVGGGFAGRAVAHSVVNAYNENNPENTKFQEKTTRTDQQEFVEDVEHERTVTDYPQGAVERAEAAMHKWYSQQYPNNPELLEQRVEAINQYNAEHGTDINPYRALRVMSLAHQDPNHLVYTDAWGHQYNYSHNQINAMENVFEPGTAVMEHPEAMDLVRHFDMNHLDAKGYVGAIDGHVAKPFDVYSDLGELPTQHTETYTVPETVVRDVDVVEYKPVSAGGLAMFGTYSPRQVFKQLRDRVGAFIGKIKQRGGVLQPEPTPVPVKVEDADTDEQLFGPAEEPEIVEPVKEKPGKVEQNDTDEDLVAPVKGPDTMDPAEIEKPAAEDKLPKPVHVEEPKPVKDPKEEIDWEKYQRPFTFEYDNPYNLRKNMNLSDNTVRGINVGQLLKKQEPKEPRQAAHQETPITPVVPPIRPEPTSTLEPPLGGKNTAIDAALDKAYQQTITPHDDREYFVPDALTKLAEQADVMEAPIGTYGGEPVRLVDINGNDNPVSQTQDTAGTAVVVVEVSGLRIPFCLATGMNTARNDIPGHWYPATNMTHRGTFYTPTNVINNAELMKIAEMLDSRIGDIRNWSDTKLTEEYVSAGHTGFIGGCDVMPDINSGKVRNLLSSPVYEDPETGLKHQLFGTTPVNHELSLTPSVLGRALREIRERGGQVKGDVRDIGRRLKNRFGGLFHRDTENDM